MPRMRTRTRLHAAVGDNGRFQQVFIIFNNVLTNEKLTDRYLIPFLALVLYNLEKFLLFHSYIG